MHELNYDESIIFLTLITLAKPTPRETKLLSDIDDQQGFRFQIPVIIAYKNNPSILKRKDPFQVREALGRKFAL